MRDFSGRRGSALLIVLGMLSFMVVSAVGFAVYMRQGRTPSSYVRRSVSSRMLLKSALANAIARIDGKYTEANGNKWAVEGIHDDVYPGVANRTIEQNGNFWRNRVFTPFGPCSSDSTVSTLTLEGLAYLPPAIINEARIFSRTTRTAAWSILSYDLGRYAFSAIDVSDCFDINKVDALYRRTSSPGERISFSSMFESSERSKLQDALDKSMSNPEYYVSMADFNVVNQDSDFAPFGQYIKNGGKNGIVYDKSDYRAVSNALFITDTWFPPTNTTVKTKVYDLASSQPFKTYDANADMYSVDKQTTKDSFAKMVRLNIGPIGMFTLYDYLDKDNLPLSYCIPTVETAAMITGIGVRPALKLKFEEDTGGSITGTHPDSKGTKDPNTGLVYQRKRTAHRYHLTSLGGNNGKLAITGTAVFPFKRAEKKQKYCLDFKGEVLVKIFMGLEGMVSRVSEDTALYSDRDEWESTPEAGQCKNGVISIRTKFRQTLSFDDNLEDGASENAVKQWQALVQLPELDMPAFWYVEDEEDAINGTSFGNYYSLDNIVNQDKALRPRNDKGEIPDWWNQAKWQSTDSATWAPGGTWSANWQNLPERQAIYDTATKFVPHVCVWVRLENADGDDSGETVDMVPARLQDDVDWLGSSTRTLTLENQNVFGTEVPLLDFRGTRAFTYTKDGANSAVQMLNGTDADPMKWQFLYVIDPRYNFAPENWYAVSDSTGDMTEEKWLGQVRQVLGKNGRDKDIFMFTSDQEYLQSIGELAFLPALDYMEGNASGWGNYKVDISFKGSSQDQSARTSWENTACKDLYWKTYSPFYDPIYSMPEDGTPVEVVCGRNSFRANPFSPDGRIMSSVVRGTPFDYFTASTNDTCGVAGCKNMKADAGYKWTFDSEWGWKDGGKSDRNSVGSRILSKLSQNFRSAAAGLTGRCIWEELYDDFDWGLRNGEGGTEDNQLDFLGAQLNDPLHGVDRKYLYSFWRECLQNRQQLFLVFVRAEPLTVGGMGTRSLSNTQLGARAVALVWRDPLPPTSSASKSKSSSRNDIIPHRTRVLFYHQFE